MSEDKKEINVQSRKDKQLVYARTFQLLCITLSIVGAIWGLDELLLSISKGVPVTPLSIVMMVDGLLGSFASEVFIRITKRQIEAEKASGFLGKDDDTKDRERKENG